MPLVLGLTGPKGVGKSTTAREICKMGLPVVIVHAAEPIKAVLRGIYQAHGYDDAAIWRRLDGDLKRQPCVVLGGKSPTTAMLEVGDWGVGTNADMWLEPWRRSAYEAMSRGLGVINDSVRRPREADAIRRLDGCLVRLVPVESRWRKLGRLLSHATERSISADATVTVSGTPRDVAERVLKISSYIRA